MKQNYSIKLKPETLLDLRLIAKQRGVKTSELVRSTLEDQVEISLRPMAFAKEMERRIHEFNNKMRESLNDK